MQLYRNTETGEFGVNESGIMSHFEGLGIIVFWSMPFEPREPFEAYRLTDPPEHSADTHKCVEAAPKLVSGEYVQQWKKVKLTTDELAQRAAERQAQEQAEREARRIVITRTQGLITLYRKKGIKEDDIQALIDAIEDPDERYEAGLYFRAANWHSDDRFVKLIAPHFGAESEADLLALFEYGRTA